MAVLLGAVARRHVATEEDLAALRRRLPLLALVAAVERVLLVERKSARSLQHWAVTAVATDRVARLRRAIRTPSADAPPKSTRSALALGAASLRATND